jgi:hypothetical protein
MTFIFNSEINDYELRTDKFSNRDDNCPCGSNQPWKECGAIPTTLHHQLVTLGPNWWEDESKIAIQFKEWLKETEAGNIKVDMFANLLTGIALRHTADHDSEWLDKIFDLSASLETYQEGTVDHDYFKQIKKLIDEHK